MTIWRKAKTVPCNMNLQRISPQSHRLGISHGQTFILHYLPTATKGQTEAIGLPLRFSSFHYQDWRTPGTHWKHRKQTCAQVLRGGPCMCGLCITFFVRTTFTYPSKRPQHYFPYPETIFHDLTSPHRRNIATTKARLSPLHASRQL